VLDASAIFQHLLPITYHIKAGRKRSDLGGEKPTVGTRRCRVLLA
jgi:hypothetical protein